MIAFPVDQTGLEPATFFLLGDIILETRFPTGLSLTLSGASATMGFCHLEWLFTANLFVLGLCSFPFCILAHYFVDLVGNAPT